MKLLLFIAIIMMGCKASANLNALVQEDTSLKMLTYGLRILERERVMSTVAKKYGFSYYSVAGCMVTSELVDSVDKQNKKVNIVLQRRFGKNWQDDFRKEVDTLIVRQEQILKLVRRDTEILIREKELEPSNEYIDYNIDFGNEPNSFYITAIEYKYEEGRFRENIFKKFLVDLNSHKITTVGPGN
jgi:hypothetical protein